MKDFLLFVAFVCMALALTAQEKTTLPLTTKSGTPVQSTRAVVIGISDYQNLPDLRFADRDAQAFAAWLQTESGGKLPAGNILLLLNQQATAGKVAMALLWLVTESQAGDRAIIYFSGHGDVESKLLNQPGYLLCWDAPPNVYMGSGSPKVSDIQDVVSTLILANKAKVLLVTDACHAGKLAGSDIFGVQITNNNLAKPFVDEVKILSCQPNEFSLEGEQWGGGRGVFSYHLVDGLYGMADNDENGAVKVKEIGRYLDDMVPAEVAPQAQNPLVVGDREALIAFVSGEELAKLREKKRGEQPVISASDMRGYDDVVLARADSSVRELYDAFVAAIESGKLMPDAGNPGKSADDYYRVLIREPSIQSLHGLMTRNFVAALADEAQQVVNKLLRTDPKIVDEAFPGRVRYAHLPAYLARAAEILGDRHYMYRYLKAKQYFFEAKTYTQAQYPAIPADSLFALGNRALYQALAYDSAAAYAWLELGLNYYWKRADCVKSAQLFQKALDLSPTWVLALYYRGYALVSLDGLPTAATYMKAAIRYDSTFLPAYERLGYFEPENEIYWRNEYVRRMQEWMARDSNGIPAVYYRYLGLTLFNLSRYPEAEKYLLKGAEMTDWKDPLYYKQLAMVYEEQGQYADMCRCYDKFSDLMPNYYAMYSSLAHCGKIQKSKKGSILSHRQQCIKNHGNACDLYRFYNINHQFDLSRQIGREHAELIRQDTLSNLADKGYGYWWYGSTILAETASKEHVRRVEQSGDSLAKAGLSSKFGVYGDLVMVNLAQGDVKEAEYWFAKRGRLDACYHPSRWDGWGFGLQTWLAYAQGNYPEADSLIEIRSKEVPAYDLIEDMLVVVSICGQVDYAIFCLDKALRRYPGNAHLHYHLARLYLEQKNDYAKGLPLLEQAVQLDKGSYVPFHYYLAATYAHLGKNDAALEYLEKALELGYDDPEGIRADERWAGLRGTTAYRTLIGRYLKE